MTIRARELVSFHPDEMCPFVQAPSMRPWYCKWCAITDKYKMYQRLLAISQDKDAEKDEILGLFRLVYVPAVAQMSGSAQSSFDRTLTNIADSKYDKNCLATFAVCRYMQDNWFAGASKLIKVMEVVSSSSNFLASLVFDGTVKAMSVLIVNSVISQYQDATGISFSPSDILQFYSKLFGEKEIKLLESLVDIDCL